MPGVCDRYLLRMDNKLVELAKGEGHGGDVLLTATRERDFTLYETTGKWIPDE